MSDLLYPSNQKPLITKTQVDFFATGDVTLVDLPQEDQRLMVIAVTIDNVYVRGTTATEPAITIDDGTTGENLVASTTLTDPVEDKAFNLALVSGATQTYTITGTRTVRLHKGTVGLGQATTFRARTDNVATLTTAAVHGFVPGDLITVASVGGTGYNGTVIVTTVPTTTTFTYVNVGDDEASTADTAGRVGACIGVVTVVAV